MTKTTAPPRFDPDIYSKKTLNDLVVYAVYYLHKQGSEITAEDIVSACFVLFPKRFSLQKYPQWPDSAIVSRRWSDAKSRRFMTGNAVKGFKITATGIRQARKIEKSLGKVKRAAPAAKQTVHGELKIRAGRFVRSMETSDAFTHYKQKREINEFDFRSLLLCTMESPPETLTRNLVQFKEYAGIRERADLLKLLSHCEEKFAGLLVTKKSSSAGTRRKKK